METQNRFQWRVLGESVRGAAHERAGMPNQDAILYSPSTDDNLPVILCVSDGHGSAKYFRSDEGAVIAASVADEVLHGFLESQPDINNLSVIKRFAEEKLPQMLVRRWRESVDEHIAANPLTEDDLKSLENKHGADVRQIAETNLPLAYGATMLITVVAQDFILYMQLGDGDILTVSDTGEVTKPLTKDERLFANETTSLCSRDAWRDFRISFQTVSGTPPALILVSTDGYANSFRDESGFLKVGSDLLKMMRTDGIKNVEDNLEIWLADASASGSGDDVTLGIICRDDAVAKSLENSPASEAQPTVAESVSIEALSEIKPGTSPIGNSAAEATSREAE
jgi:serine/threonine protein phosphatase PrpC